MFVVCRLSFIWQQGHKSSAFNGPFCLTLAGCTIAASFLGIDFTSVCQQLLQRPYILIVNVFFASSAEAAFGLFTGCTEFLLSSSPGS